jgi:predicted GNAT superfamily acetyltransferase
MRPSAVKAPATILRIAQYVGGVTAGAFAPDGRLLGFVFGMTGVRDGRLAHWSDLLAVRPEARDHGLGTRLKRYQCALLLPLGVEAMYWTFDPLVARNAHLNLNHLGARVAEHVRDMYGPDTGSVTHAALGTDRFIVRWDLRAAQSGEVPERAGAAASAGASAPAVNAPWPGTDTPVDGELVDAPAVRVEVPNDIMRLVAETPDVARRWRESTRRAFLHYLGRGYRVAAFERDPDGGRASYRLVAA